MSYYTVFHRRIQAADGSFVTLSRSANLSDRPDFGETIGFNEGHGGMRKLGVADSFVVIGHSPEPYIQVEFRTDCSDIVTDAFDAIANAVKEHWRPVLKYSYGHEEEAMDDLNANFDERFEVVKFLGKYCVVNKAEAHAINEVIGLRKKNAEAAASEVSK